MEPILPPLVSTSLPICDWSCCPRRDIQAAAAEMAKTEALQKQIWANAVPATELPGAHRDAGKLLLPALNNMIDMTTTRTMSIQIHPPTIVVVVYVILDLDYLSEGLIRLQAADQLLLKARQAMNRCLHPSFRRLATNLCETPDQKQ